MGNFWFVDLPNWMVAVGTVGAFATGGVVLLRELGRDREREAAVVRQQATTIAAWPVRRHDPNSAPPTISSALTLSNASHEPVYAVQIEYQGKASAETVADQIDVLPPGLCERDLPAPFQDVWVKGPDGWVKRIAPGMAPVANPQNESWDFLVALDFTDSRGRRWRRETDGSICDG